MNSSKTNVIAWVLIIAIFIAFSIVNSFQMKKQQQVKQQQDSIRAVAAALQSTLPKVEKDSLVATDTSATSAQIIQTKTTEEITTIENDKLIIQFSNHGGRIVSVELKDYQNYSDFQKGNGETLKLFNGEGNNFYATVYTKQDNFRTSEFYFERKTQAPIPNNVLNVSQSSDSIYRLSYRLAIQENQYIEYNYTIPKSGFDVGFEIKFINLDNLLMPNMVDFNIYLQTTLFRQERGFDNENNYSTIAYHSLRDNDFEDLGRSKEDATEEVTANLNWIAFKQQFFSTIIVAEKQPITNSKLAFHTYSGKENSADAHLLKTYSAELTVPIVKEHPNQFQFRYYFLPNHYETLKSYNHNFERLVPLGWGIFGWINKWIVIPIFNFLDNYILSYGFIILILTLIIKLGLSPLTYKSFKSMAKMRILKPEMDKISKKYPKKEDALKKQQELNLLFKRTGVNQFGGCLPMLLQMPFLIALFNFFPASFELRQKTFLWAEDLSAFDSVLNLPFNIPFYGNHISLFTLLMAITLFISSKMSMNNSPTENSMPGMKFMTLYLMPVMLVVWFNGYASGLTYYYFLSNFIGIGQNLIIRRIIDEDKLLAKINERSKRPVKKSKWQMKLEEMARKQQAQRKK